MTFPRFGSRRRKRDPGKKSPKGKLQTPAKKAPSTIVTPANALQLQSLIGNKAVQRLIDKQSKGQQNGQSDVMQRTKDTGMSTSGSITTFISEARFTFGMRNANDPVKTVIEGELKTKVDETLRAQGCPPVQAISVDDSIDANGTFSPFDWTIRINPKLYEGAATVGEMRADQKTQIVNTIYHEARHCEQDFRVARMLAGQELNQRKKKDREAAKATIAQNIAYNVMHLPLNIAQLAVATPLYKNITAKIFGWLGVKDTAYEQARAWYESMYGKHKSYRTFIMDDSGFRKDIDDMAVPVTEIEDKTPEKYADLVADGVKRKAQMKIDSGIGVWMGMIGPHFEKFINLLAKLVGYRDNQITTETQLVTDGTSDAEKIMRLHLAKFKTMIDEIEKLNKESTDIKKTMNAIVDQLILLKDERHDAYTHLAEEADAFATGDRAGKRFGEIV
jgi:hypothetical protein